MTKQNVVVPEPMAISVPAVANSSPLFPYPLPRVGCGGGGAGGLAMKKKYLSQLELGGARINAWVESMKASSPTHAKAAAALAAAPSVGAQDEHATWIVSSIRAIPLRFAVFGSKIRS